MNTFTTFLFFGLLAYAASQGYSSVGGGEGFGGFGHHGHHGFGGSSGGAGGGSGGGQGGGDGGHGHHGHHFVDYYAHPHYKYEYEVHDSHTGDVHAQKEERDGDKVKGYYTLKEADGTTREVHYEADKHNGFNAVVKRVGHAVHPVHTVHHKSSHHY